MLLPLRRADGRELGGVPAAAQRLDQRRRGDEAALQDRERRLLVAERGGLRHHHAGIGDRAGLVLVEGELLRAARRAQGHVLRRRLLLEDAQRGELVLDLLERGQYGLAIGRDIPLI